MQTSVTRSQKELMREIKGLSPDKIKELLDFVYFLKAKEAIDPSQMYYWTKRWQGMEREADSDKKRRKIIGDGSLPDLLKKLKK